MSLRCSVLRRPAHFCVLVASILALTTELAISESGVDTYKPPNSKDPDSISSKDIFKLLDKSLGKKFKDLIVINGGCYTSGFTDAGANSAVAASGNNVAIMASTDAACPREEAQGTQQGNSYLQGVANGFSPTSTLDGTPGTVSAADAAGKQRIKRDNPDNQKPPQNPTLTTTGGGANIQLGRGASSYHAILFAGKPTTCADWNDIHKMYDTLIDSGYSADNVQVLFGSGGRGSDGTPQLLKDDGTPGPSIGEVNNSAENKLKGCNYEPELGKDGKPKQVKLQPATQANFKKALVNLAAIAANSSTEQYFVWTGTHNTSSATSVEVSYSRPRTATGTEIATSGVPSGPPQLATGTWTGPYVGFNGGGATGDSRWEEGDSTTGNFPISGWFGGATLGYNQQVGNLVFGTEADIDGGSIRGSTTVNCTARCQSANNFLATALGRVGIPVANSSLSIGYSILPYVTGGGAFGNVAANIGGFPGESTLRAGWTVGGGVETDLGGGLSGKIELLRLHLTGACSLSGCGGTPTIPLDTTLIRFGLNFHLPAGSEPRLSPPPIITK